MIEVAPLAFMRGRTLNDSFVILDEAQNTTPEQMKMFLTRLGFGSRMVVTGDVTQIDLPTDQRSGLMVGARHPRRVKDISFIEFGGEDVVRHKLVQRIVAAYDRHGASRSCLTCPPTCASRSRRRSPLVGVDDGHLAVEIVDAERIQSSTATTAARTSRPTCSPSRSTNSARPPGPRELGDVAICPELCLDMTLTETVVHGVLHLCGHDHETDDGEMLALQGQVLASLR